MEDVIMKKAINIIWIVSMILASIILGVMGIKIFNNDYNITIEAYTVLVLWIILLFCGLYKNFTRNKCPYCGKVNLSGGNYCSYCGKKITKGE